MTKAQRSYFAFTRAVRDSQGITFRQAQAVYRAYKERGEAPTAKAVREHPRVISRLSAQASSQGRAASVSRGQAGSQEVSRGGGGSISRGRSVDLDTWIDEYYDFDDYEDYDIEAGIDYTRNK